MSGCQDVWISGCLDAWLSTVKEGGRRRRGHQTGQDRPGREETRLPGILDYEDLLID